MSSILKALKKLEAESPKKDDLPSLPKKIDTKKAITKRAKGAWLANRVFAFFIVSTLLAATVLLIISRQSFFQKPISTKSTGSAIRKETGLTENLIKDSGPVREKIVSASDDGTEQTDLQANNIAIKRKKREETFPKREAVSLSGNFDQKRPISQNSLPEKPVINTTSFSGKTAQLDLSGFKLEAIVWSNNPESRFAVINGKIVRIGGTVEGLSLLNISREYVTMKKGEKEGKLKFIHG